MIKIENPELKNYTSFKIGGKSKYIFFPETIEELIELIKNLKSSNEKFFILGGGSNVLISDEFYDG